MLVLYTIISSAANLLCTVHSDLNFNNKCPKMQVLYTVYSSTELINGNFKPVYKAIREESLVLGHKNSFLM